MDIELGRPIKFLFKTSSIDYLKDLNSVLCETFVLPEPLVTPRDGTDALNRR